jgi:hypothetical protein
VHDTSRAGIRYFVVRFLGVEIHGSAHRHGVPEEDMLHAVDHSLVVDDLGDDPDRWLVLGPDTAGNLLEVVVLISTEGDEIITTRCRCDRSSGGSSNDDC